MLQRLQIDNIALIIRQELQLQPGLTVITGETGAGKSMILDALNLVLGERADSGLLRQGSEQATVQSTFYLASDHPLHQWLQEREMPAEEELFLRRVITSGGRSRAFVNEVAVPLNVLKQAGDLLVDIHGQHDHQSLLDSHSHLAILDAYAGCTSLATSVREAWQHWQDAQNALETLRKKAADAESRRTFLAYQVEELEKVAVQPGELQELENQRGRQAHADRLAQTVDHALEALHHGRSSAITLVHQAAGELEGVANLDAALQTLAAALRSLHYELDDVAERLVHYRSGLESDPLLLEQMDERIAQIRLLARKHRRQADELPILLEEWRNELNLLDDFDSLEVKLQRELKNARRVYDEQATELSKARQVAALGLQKEVEEQLRELYMANTRFAVSLTPLTGEPRASGMEGVALLVSANPGEPLKPMRQVASGGELSRIMLALRSVLADAAPIATLIFDEVDAGVGGRVADAIGAKLARIAQQGKQVIAITHLPQVAARGAHHWRVEKQVNGQQTQVTISVLNQEERVEELARMLAGETITRPAREQAEELLRMAR
ncbi:MAG: DNA repair protein RecN [Magnetococcales bacterium]|nr:DNA repair protein RecN [Magnetococcales bacterium]NGZ27094.1 DNA repair protein RecN [Magnetococcales bacterium]